MILSVLTSMKLPAIFEIPTLYRHKSRDVSFLVCVDSSTGTAKMPAAMKADDQRHL